MKVLMGHRAIWPESGRGWERACHCQFARTLVSVHICPPLFRKRYDGTKACSGNEIILSGNIEIIMYTLELILHALNSCSDILISE